jgi:hypothetical protein
MYNIPGYSQHVWALGHRSKFVTVKHNLNQYLIGFQNKYIATRVADKISTTKEPTLYRSMKENVALDVKQSMMEMQLPISRVADTITIDVMAELYIPKQQAFVEQSARLELERYDGYEFLMLPFDSGVGIVIPYELFSDTKEEYLFMCHVVDPCNLKDMFKKLF